MHHLHWLAGHQEQPDGLAVASEHRQGLDGVRVGHGALQQVVTNLQHSQGSSVSNIPPKSKSMFPIYKLDTERLLITSSLIFLR